MKREEKSLSRRSFLKGGLATLGLVAGTLLSGCKNPNDHLIPPEEAEKGKERPIPGLYAAGNVQGGRFLVDYPVVTAGVSHAFALVYGRLAGTQAAKCNPEEIMQAMRS